MLETLIFSTTTFIVTIGPVDASIAFLGLTAYYLDFVMHCIRSDVTSITYSKSTSLMAWFDWIKRYYARYGRSTHCASLYNLYLTALAESKLFYN